MRSCAAREIGKMSEIICVRWEMHELTENPRVSREMHETWRVTIVALPCYNTVHTHTHTHNRFTALFLGPPGSAGARRRELLDFVVQGKINRGRHTVRLGTTLD